MCWSYTSITRDTSYREAMFWSIYRAMSSVGRFPAPRPMPYTEESSSSCRFVWICPKTWALEKASCKLLWPWNPSRMPGAMFSSSRWKRRVTWLRYMLPRVSTI